MESMEWGVDSRNSRWNEWNGGWTPYFFKMESMEWGMDSMDWGMDSILHHAPLIPAGMNPFHWNTPESAGMIQESTGMDQNPQEWNRNGQECHWNATGMTKMDILELKPQ